jgi:hypothetical protein
MKASLSKITSLAAGIMLALALTLTGCAEDPANNNSGGGGIDDNGQQQGSGGGGGGGTNYTISELTINNSTGYQICYTYIKPSISTDWGSDLGSCVSDGQSKKITFSKPLSATNGVDIRLGTSSNISSGNTFIKYKFTVSNGMAVTFTASDLTDGSNLPSITIQNRSGVNFNAIYIRPSSVPDESSDWGRDYGSLSNNSDKSISIPIPPSSYTTFDIQMRSSNPTNTYTRNNVTISNGMILTYTSADSDNPLIGSPIIVIQNNTGYQICYTYIKPSTSTDWGSDLGSCLSDGTSRTFTLSQSLSANSVDIRLGTSSNISSGNTFIKYKFTVSDGMIVPFTISDLTDGSNLPSITIQNRSGVNFNAIYVKPSEASDWGRDYGSLSNNSDKSISIPIPSTSYTTFDIQMRSSNPTNTYTRNNVTISNGMILTYTSADSDNPLTSPPIIVIQNSTGYSICYAYIKPSTSTDWGSDVGSCMSDRTSRTFTLSQALSANSVDIRLGTSSSINSGNQFIKSGVLVTDGMIVNFTSSDLE